jgi:hypothetical protein
MKTFASTFPDRQARDRIRVYGFRRADIGAELGDTNLEALARAVDALGLRISDHR